MDEKSNIVLLGMMGAGKSTIGHILASKLIGFDFVDIDKEIEKKEKSTISEIFETKGETHFREVEVQLVKYFSAFKNTIISTGGGVVENQESIQNLKTNGILFYLSASPKALLERLVNTSDRPLINNSNPLKTIEERLAKRKNGYKMADYEINTEKREIMSVITEILEKYEEYESNRIKS